MATAKSIGRETAERTVRRVRLRIASSAAGAAALAVYLFTLAPSVGFIDAGELAAVAHTFGIAHPTGYPLFTVLAGIWAYLPLGDGIVRLNVFAAVLAASAVVLHVYLIHFLLGLFRRKPSRREKGKKSSGVGAKGNPVPLPEDVRIALAAFGALFIAFSETFWKTALSVEVYALHLPLVTAAILFFVRATLDPSAGDTMRRRFLSAAALVLGLSFSNHMTTLLLLPAFAIVYFRVHGFGAPAWKGVGRAAPFFAVGLLPYFYLPLRAAASPVLNWGNPTTFERFLWHITGRQYQVWMFEGLKAAGKQLSWFLSTYPAEFGWVGAALCAAGAVAVFRRERLVGTFLALLFLGCVAYAVNYSIYDIESYFLLAYMTSGVWAAFGLGAVYAVSRKRRAIPLIAGAIALGVLLGANFPSVSQRGNHLVEDYSRNMFASLEPNAIILSYQWDYWVSASYYYQLVERLRPDVVVIDKELLRRSWYFEQLRRWHPDIYR
ncbi:MAG: DUF2723 domain-containing protein, partial [Bacteroidota bacterium]|nr:DUF2723 domain-containing protein [Bacteroidota bacterium]